mmetsp:Transcript_19886/g.49365  ORF Transcript_19886/g.49365 Transcript_19886/m.49365 type:complete len:232 (-) Transcript_19886:1313-2008(-)
MDPSVPPPGSRTSSPPASSIIARGGTGVESRMYTLVVRTRSWNATYAERHWFPSSCALTLEGCTEAASGSAHVRSPGRTCSFTAEDDAGPFLVGGACRYASWGYNPAHSSPARSPAGTPEAPGPPPPAASPPPRLSLSTVVAAAAVEVCPSTRRTPSLPSCLRPTHSVCPARIPRGTTPRLDRFSSSCRLLLATCCSVLMDRKRSRAKEKRDSPAMASNSLYAWRAPSTSL